MLPGEWCRRENERQELGEMRASIIHITSAFYAFIGNENTSKRQCIFIIFFLVLLGLVQPLTEVLLAAVTGRKSHPLQQEQSLSLSCAPSQIYHNKAL